MIGPEHFRRRTQGFQRRLADGDVDVAVLTDPDTIAYLGGFWNYLGVQWGRPTFLVVPRADAPVLVTPLMESAMAGVMTWIDDVRPWEDGGDEWHGVLAGALPAGTRTIGIEADKTHAAADRFVREAAPNVIDVSRAIGEMRMIKDADEIAVMRQAGEVAVAAIDAGRHAIAEGVPEYEMCLALMAGGTRKAAELLGDATPEALFTSPMMHNLEILQSGHDTSMVHRRASTRRVQTGEVVYFCLCGMIDFRLYKLGFDREFFLGSVSDEHARVHETCLAAQAAALAAIRPGIAAEDVHLAAAEVYQSAGFGAGYRTGRAVGVSFLEKPELKIGDRTPLAPGMTFAVDGGITVPGDFGARIGDSIVVTDDGYEVLTPYPRELTIV